MFYSIYHKDTGELFSTAHGDKKQVVADPLPSHLALKARSTNPDMAKMKWDTTLLKWVKRPTVPPTRLQVLVSMDPAQMSETEKIELMQYLGGRVQ